MTSACQEESFVVVSYLRESRLTKRPLRHSLDRSQHSTIGSLGSSVWTGVCEGGLRRSAVGLKTSSEGEIDVAIAWPLTLRSEGPEA